MEDAPDESIKTEMRRLIQKVESMWLQKKIWDQQ
jgi:hypothetical protein